MQTHTVGVFDSGFGGLTVLRALLPRLPGTHFVYLGDTARLPYGAKSQATVARYAIEAARFLVGQGADLLVIACNTATALALPEIRAAVPVPVLGVVEPGAKAAQTSVDAVILSPSVDAGILSEAPPSVKAGILSEAPPSVKAGILSEAPQGRSRRTPVFDQARAGDGVPGELARWGGEGTSLSPPTPQPANILVLATAATVASHAYRDTCATLNLHATEMPCPLLVPLVEEGWTDHPVTREVLRIYLTEALTRTTPDAVLLGCTHYPLIAPLITETLRNLGCTAPIVDSAEATAQATQAVLNPGGGSRDATPTTASTFICYATDSTEKFARLGSHFLGQPIPEVHLLDLGG